jgi:hypothetical protein
MKRHQIEKFTDYSCGALCILMVAIQISRYLCDPDSPLNGGSFFNIKLVAIGLTFGSFMVFIYFVWRRRQYEKYMQSIILKEPIQIFKNPCSDGFYPSEIKPTLFRVKLLDLLETHGLKGRCLTIWIDDGGHMALALE